MTPLSSRRGRSLLAGLMVLMSLSVAACSGQTASVGGSASGKDSGDGGGKSVSIAVVPGWDDAVAVTYLWKELLEQRDYSVKVQELDVASTFAGVANGQVDMYLDAWLPVTHEAYWTRFENKLEVVTEWSSGQNLLAVPEYVDADSVDDLKGRAPEFGGRIVGIEAGAGLMRATREQAMPKYGLDDYQLVEGSSPAMLAALNTAIKKKEPNVVTLWQPHWAFSKYPIKVLEDPEGAFGKPDDIRGVATKGFSADQAEIAGWMKKFKLTPDQLGSAMLAIREGGEGNEQESIKKWIADNKEVVDAWFA